ncbi:MAG TPA: preprotein translocase subunit YajC [Blastocatellia bacterium]|nr:preprotein translocase subunit YajC [Blastocatellia bacterium]
MNMTIALAHPLFLLQQPGGGLLGAFLPMILIFGIFYFLVIRPQQKRQRQQQTEREVMLKALKAGDKVITTGGIYGTIVSVKEKDDTVVLRIAQAVTIEMLRSAIAGPQSADAKDVEVAK